MTGKFRPWAAVAVVSLLFAGCGSGSSGTDLGRDVTEDVTGEVSEDASVDLPGDAVIDAGMDARTDTPAEDISVDGSGDDVAPPDNGSDTTNPGGVEQPTPEGRVLIAVAGWGGEYGTDAWISADFFSGPMRMDAFSAYTPGLHRTMAKSGDCVYYAATDAACNPVCDWDKYCNADNACVSAPARQGAGKLTVTVGTTSVSADPSTDEWMPGYYYFDSIRSNLLTPATTVKAEAAGGEFPAFSLETTGIAPLEFDLDLANNALDLKDGADAVITWPAGGAEGTVQLVLNVGWHGAPPESVLFCEAPASAGTITIDRSIIESLPVIGGPALMQHGSHIAVNRTVNTEIGGRTVELTVSMRAGLNPTHNAPEL